MLVVFLDFQKTTDKCDLHLPACHSIVFYSFISVETLKGVRFFERWVKMARLSLI